MTKINVCLLQPPGFIHAFALLEAAEYIAHKAKLLGYDVSLAKNRLVSSSLNIVFGAHINPSQREPYPTGTVIFNTEQLSSNSVWITNGYKNILDKYFVWDYSQDNLNQISHQNKALVNFYHVDELQRIICHENKKYDLLFYGSMNDRRKAILDNISKKGISIHFVSALYGPERDLLLGECRAVLNLHFYDSQIFQQIRAFYPLINNIPVISENFPLTSAPSIFHDAVFTPGGEEFEKFVAQLLKDNSNFEELSKVKIENFPEINGRRGRD